jgi:hypothetical protein
MLPPDSPGIGYCLHLMTFLAQVFRQTVPVPAPRPPCPGTALRYDPFCVGVMTGDAGHFPVFVQRKSYVIFYFHYFDLFQSSGRRDEAHMVDISGVIPGDVVAPAAHRFNISDEGDFFEGRMFFIGFFLMADKTGSYDDLIVFVQLLMRVGLSIIFLDMTVVAKISSSRIRCATQRIPLKQPFLALPVDIMACQAGQLPVLQFKIHRNSFLFFRARCNIKRMDRNIRGIGMTAA